MSLGIIVLGVLLTRDWFGPGPAKAAGLLLACWPSQIEFTTVLASETYFNFLVLLGIWAWSRRSWPTALRGAAAGLALAGASYVRPLALLVPAVLVGCDLLRRERMGATLALAAVAGIAMLAAILPWSYRNTRVFDRFVLISTNGGTNFWMGNHPGAQGDYEQLPEWTKGMNEVDREIALKKQAKEYIQDQPAAFAVRTLKKLVSTHDRETIGVAWNPGLRERFGARAESIAKGLSTAFWWGALALGLVGALLLLRREGFRGWASSPAVAFWAYFALTCSVIVAQDRYHFPSIPFIAALAGLTLSRRATPMGGTAR